MKLNRLYCTSWYWIIADSKPTETKRQLHHILITEATFIGSGHLSVFVQNTVGVSPVSYVKPIKLPMPTHINFIHPSTYYITLIHSKTMIDIGSRCYQKSDRRNVCNSLASSPACFDIWMECSRTNIKRYRAHPFRNCTIIIAGRCCVRAEWTAREVPIVRFIT